LIFELCALCFEHFGGGVSVLREGTKHKVQSSKYKAQHFVVKTDEGREQMPRTHFEAHFSRGWRARGLSQSTELIIRNRRLPAFISQKVFRLSKN
jgi:hypothetical protein